MKGLGSGKVQRFRDALMIDGGVKARAAKRHHTEFCDADNPDIKATKYVEYKVALAKAQVYREVVELLDSFLREVK
jgi:hypothetical protein